MLPVVSVGVFQFQTIWIFIILAILTFAFIIFLQSEDQILPTAKVFDCLIISAISGLILGKLASFFLQVEQSDFLLVAKLSPDIEINFWAAIVGSLMVLTIVATKFKLPALKLADIVSLALIPSLAIFYLGRIIGWGLSAISIFAIIWFGLATFGFWKAGQKIQFTGFYLLLSAILIAFFQIIFEILQVNSEQLKTYNLTISSLVLTTATVVFYNKKSRNFYQDLKMIKTQTTNTLQRVKRLLLRQRKTLEDQITKLAKDDPFLAEGRTVSRESGEDAAEFEGHERITIVRENLKRSLFQVKKALAAIGIGKYGKCDKCGQKIEAARLEVLPEATLCFKCEAEVERKSY